jgi:Ricin-type beta-trefoil lectin domain-like
MSVHFCKKWRPETTPLKKRGVTLKSHTSKKPQKKNKERIMQFQVRSSGQRLNVLDSNPANGAAVVQGNVPTTPNFDWTLVPSTTAGGYFLVKCNATGQYLNILDAATNNGAKAVQGNTPTTDNFLWQFIPSNGEYFQLKVKSSGQYLNILNAATNNGAPACQGNTPTTDNFLWKII